MMRCAVWSGDCAEAILQTRKRAKTSRIPVFIPVFSKCLDDVPNVIARFARLPNSKSAVIVCAQEDPKNVRSCTVGQTTTLSTRRGFGATQRRDRWWIEPLLIFVGLGGFIVYATWAAFQGNHYYWGPYLSPFYSPEIFGDSVHSWFVPRPSWWPFVIPFSPALLILWAPGGFRFTCYYYRGSYYKAFWADPPSCAVGEPRKNYLGEAKLPLILQNVHRYFLYLALIFVVILA